MNNFEQLARVMTMEYFKANNLFSVSSTEIENTVVEFAKIEQEFYNALNKNGIKFKKVANP